MVEAAVRKLDESLSVLVEERARPADRGDGQVNG